LHELIANWDSDTYMDISNEKRQNQEKDMKCETLKDQ
jgi:hypothetical protein